MPRTPHDILVKKTLAIAENAEGELRAILPPELAARIDWSTLETEPGSFVDREARQWHTDLLFSVRLAGRTVYLYLLLEHQSTVDPWMPLRMLTYETQAWVSLREPGTKLPVIIPLVLHHGARGWTASRHFVDLLDADEELLGLVGPYVPGFEILVDDLTRVSEVELLERSMTAMTRITLWALRAQRLGHDPELMERWARELEAAQRSAGREAFEVFFVYLTAVEGGSELMQAILGTDVEDGVREVVMGLRKQWEESAEARGREEALRDVAFKLLRLRFGELPQEVSERLRTASADDLERWTERVLVAEELDGVWR